MATKPENKAEKDVEDDFVILETFENMADSTTSNASTIPEKQTFESQEKLSESSGESSMNEKPKHSDTSSSLGESSINEQPNTDSFSSLGDSMINVLPYYESSRFIDKQLGQERKLGVLGEGDGREKGDEMCSEKGGSAIESGKGEECKGEGEGDNVGEGSGREKGDEMCSDKGAFQIEGGKSGEGKGDDKGYGEEKGKGGGKGGKMSSGEEGKVQDDNVRVEGYGEGRARGSRRGEKIDSGVGDIEGSWMYVEGEVGIGGDGGVGDLMMSVGGGRQKQGGITVLPGNMVKERRNKNDEAMDEESVSGADTKLVGGGKQKEKMNKGEDGKLVEDDDVDECETKAEDKMERNIPSDGQTEVHQYHVEDIPSEEYSSAEDEIPVDASTQFQEDSSHQMGESSESMLGLDDGLSDKGSLNMEDLVAVESSTDAEGHHVTGSPDESDPMVPNPAADQDPPSLPKQAQQDGQHEQMNVDDDHPDDSSGSFGHSNPNQSEQDVPLLPHQACEEPPSSQTEQSQNEPANEDCNQPDDGTYNCSGFDHSQAKQAKQDAPILPHQAKQDPFDLSRQTEQAGEHELANEHQNLPAPDELSPLRPPQRNEQIVYDGQDAPNQPRQDPPNQPHQDPPRLPRQAQQADQQAPNETQNLPDDERAPGRPRQRNQPIEHNRRASCCSWRFLFAILGVLCSIAFMYIRPKVPLPKPIIEINTKTNVPPSASSLRLVAKCKAYNTSYTIQHCQWKQIHPLPTSPKNTVLPGGTKDCPPTTSVNHPPTHDVDATLHGLKVPTDLGTYTFELACGHEAGNTATKRVEIWVNELIPPIIAVPNPKVVVSTSTGTAKLNVSCRAVQGKIVERKWEYIDGPPELVFITPSENGVVQLSQPGIYKFKYRCTDSFGGTALSPTITVHAKPPYVLGIDLGTSTTCIAIIKEDGTRQDIGIYEDDSDVDPCMPSIVAFAQNGELLVGEKALRQAVVNPHSTIYEVKRLMGRSYYDDADHKFVYRVRPTLKSHSLKGVRAAVEIPCGKGRKKLVQPELISALILRHVSDHAQRYLGVAVKDVVISVPAQFDDAQRKATMDAGLIAGLNPVKIVNEPTVAAFAANSLTEKLLAANDEIDNAEVEKQRHTIWAVVADIGGGTTDYALMQIQGSYYKVLTTDGDKTLGGRDIDIRLTEVMTHILQDKYLGLDLTSSVFQQKLRLECENAKIVLSEKEQYSLTVEYVDQDERTENIPLEHLLKRVEFEEYVSGILDAMIKPLDSLLKRAGGSIREAIGQGVEAENIEDLYLVGGTSHIPRLKELLLSYFSNVKNVRHKDPVQLVSRGAAAFGAALTGLVQVGKMPRIDAVPLPISIAVDMDDMHVIFERNRLYPCIEKRVLTTYTNNQNAIVIKVYEGEGRTADECHFLGEFELSGIPPLPKNVPEIQAIFKIDTNGILSVKASYGDMVKGMKLDVYSKSGGMIDKTRDKMHLVLGKLMGPSSKEQAKCELLEDATPMSVIPVKPRKSNVLKLSVDSEYDSVKMVNSSDPNAMVPAIGMVTVKGLVTDYDSVTKETDLDIVLVVDLSGSMAGVPLSTMKNVILHLIDRLKENHRLGIVTYATNVHRNLELVSCTARNKNKARDIVSNFRTMGSTNLYGGLLTGLQMAYHGGRRSRVLLFTDGHANDGAWIDNDDIIREIVRESTALRSRTQAQVTLSTFGYLGEHDEFLLQQLATNVGGGTYNFLNENTALGSAFAKVLGDAIHTIAEKIELSITPLDNVQIVGAITNFKSRPESEKLTFEIPSTADQQSRHILLRLAVPPTSEQSIHAGLYRVELTYTNTLTEREEGSEEYLYVARHEKLDVETRSRDVDEQLNRVFVARQIEHALEELKTENREKSVECLKEAYNKIQNSDSKGHTLSVCLSEDLEQLIQEVEQGDLNTAKKSLQDSLTSHWQEKGGRGSCYVTRKEDKLISIFTS